MLKKLPRIGEASWTKEVPFFEEGNLGQKFNHNKTTVTSHKEFHDMLAKAQALKI